MVASYQTGWEATILATFIGHTDRVWRVVFPPGRHLARHRLRRSDGRLWDLPSGQERATLTGHTDPVQHVVFSPDGTLLATATATATFSDHPTARLWAIT